MISHICAGFDPASFWRLTPREWAIWMDASHKRLERDHRLAAVSAWIGNHYGYDDLIKHFPHEPKKLDPDALNRMLHHTSVGLMEIDMGAYLETKSQRGQ